MRTHSKPKRHHVSTLSDLEATDLWPGDTVQVGYGPMAVCFDVDGLGGLHRRRLGQVVPGQPKPRQEVA